MCGWISGHKVYIELKIEKLLFMSLLITFSYTVLDPLCSWISRHKGWLIILTMFLNELVQFTSIVSLELKIGKLVFVALLRTSLYIVSDPFCGEIPGHKRWLITLMMFLSGLIKFTSKFPLNSKQEILNWCNGLEPFLYSFGSLLR